MEQAVEAELRAAWERLSRRNRWTLVDNLEAFLREAAELYAELDQRLPPSARAEAAVAEVYRRHAEVAVLQTYGRLLYRKLVARDERAAEELRTYFYWHALDRRWPYHDAEDIANEATVRAFTQLHTLRAPESIFLWRLRVFQSAQRLLIDQRRHEAPLPTSEEGELRDLPDPESPTDQVDQRVLLEEFLALLQGSTPNALDREILVRSVVYDEKPRDIAAALARDVGFIKVRKSRALQALRKDSRFIALLQELAGQAEGPGATGVSDDR